MLVAGGVQLLVVGSAALMAHGDLPTAGDLDIVPAGDERNLECLRQELARLAGRTVGPLAERDVVRVTTSFGIIDVMVGRGRFEFDSLLARSCGHDVYGVNVAIASRHDAWRLRRRFKAAG
jgi:hypothetical protein